MRPMKREVLREQFQGSTMRRYLALPVLFFSYSCGAFAQHAGSAGAPAMMPAQGARIAAPVTSFPGVRSASVAYGSPAVHPAPHAAATVRPVPAHGTVSRPTNTASSTRISRQNANTLLDEFGNSFATNQLPVPGLGFDYVHFAAVHPNAFKNNDFRNGNNGFVIPFLGGGIYVPIPYYAEQPAAPAENAAGENTEAAENSSDTDTVTTTPYMPRSAPRLEPSSEYVFVRRDGTVFFAVAYSFNAGNLQYVTKEGLRRSVPLNALDPDATQQFNEQRGVIVHLPV
jgi:hypothetical protein